MHNETPSSDSPIMDWAKHYGARGYRVFPLRANDKLPARKGYQQDASTDSAAINGLFYGVHSGIGVGMFMPEGCCAIDLDRHNEDLAINLEVLLCHLGITLSELKYQVTPRNGLHIPYRGALAGTVAWIPNIDVQAGGKYIAAAPTQFNGKGYSWPHGVPSADELPPLPAAFRLNEKPRERLGAICEAREGTRNPTLNIQAGQLALLAIKGKLLHGEQPPVEEQLDIVSRWCLGLANSLHHWSGMDPRSHEATVKSAFKAAQDGTLHGGGGAGAAPPESQLQALFNAIPAADGAERDRALEALSGPLGAASAATQERFKCLLTQHGVPAKLATKVATGGLAETSDGLKTSADVLQMALDAGIVFRSDDTGYPFAIVPNRVANDGSKTPVFVDALKVLFHALSRAKYGTEPSDVLVRRAVEALVSQALAEHGADDRLEPMDLTPRVQRTHDRRGIAYDTREGTIIVDRDGPRLIPRGEYLFRACRLASPAPVDLTGTPDEHRAVMKQFRDLFPTVSDDDFIRAKVWLISALAPVDERFILDIGGTTRTGKSTLACGLQHVVDPCVRLENSFPGDLPSLAALACQRWVANLGNVTTLGDLGDQVCQLATGWLYQPRMLYTQGRTFDLCLCRPVIFTSVADPLSASDQADRTLRIRMQPHTAKQARSTEDTLNDLDALAPKIRGALFWALHEQMRCPAPKRDSAAVCDARFSATWPWIRGAMAYLGDGADVVAARINESIQAGLASVLESRPTLARIVDVFEARPTLGVAERVTSGELYRLIVANQDPQIVRTFVSSPRALTAAINANMPTLESAGLFLVPRNANGRAGWMRATTKWGSLNVPEKGDHDAS